MKSLWDEAKRWLRKGARFRARKTRDERDGTTFAYETYESSWEDVARQMMEVKLVDPSLPFSSSAKLEAYRLKNVLFSLLTFHWNCYSSFI